ncbi:MAG: ribonuclease D [Nitrospinae bacterium]|nr:ribonuclease D [Nitrospinota bacterium]
MLITDIKQLKSFCSSLKGVSRLAVDVEFMREKTYFPILALVQVASENDCAAIDTLAIQSLDPLLDILHNHKVMKVFHSGKQDLEIIYQNSGKPVRNIFDTQMAASLVGFGAQISLLKLVESAVGVRLNKSETYTDWTRRPLSENQVSYALNDVRYLLQAQDFLLNKLREHKREEWLEEEFIRMEDPSLYELPLPENQYRKIKGIRSLRPRELAVLRELAAWRELEARKRDRFLNAIVREETLLALARQATSCVKDLKLVRGLHPNEIKNNGPDILEAIRKGLAAPKSEWPVLPPLENDDFSNGAEGLLWSFTQHRGKKLKINPAFLASRKEIKEFVKSYKTGSAMEHTLMQGWKKKLIGHDLLSIIEGNASLGIDPRSGGLRLVVEKKVKKADHRHGQKEEERERG